MAKIKGHGRLFRQMQNPQFVQFFTIILLQMPQHVNNVPRLLVIWARLQASINNLNESFKWPLTAEETEMIELLDKQREGILTIVFDAIRDLSKYAIDPDLKAAAKGLKYQVDVYKHAKKMDYEAETAMIDNFIHAVTNAINAPRLALIGQTAMVGTLTTVNDSLQEFYENRYAKLYAHKQSGTTTKLRKIVNDIFNDFTLGVNGMLITETDPAIISELNAISDSINAAIDQFTTNLNRHLGIIRHKKNDDKEDGKEDGKENTDPQNPNTTLPPAPDTPPQNPDTGKPNIDPDELNPPAVGEH